MKSVRRDEGFTLLELMVVVLIIGILVAIAIPVFNAAKANAQEKSCFANQRTIEGCVETYAASHGTSPSAGLLDSGSWAVPMYFAAAPACPSDPSKHAYSLNARGGALCMNGAGAHAHF